MTSDFVQNNANTDRFTSGRSLPPALPKTMRRKQRTLTHKGPDSRPLELTRNAGFLDGTHDIFDVLAQHAQKEDTMERSMSATIALLKRSSLMLQDAENTIELQNTRLQKLETLSVTDEVSGLLNHRGFTRAFVKEVARTNRGHNQGGLLVMFNLENLSTIKRNYGADAPDIAVQLVAEALEKEIRETDYAARLCDDEFILLFTNTDMEHALVRLQSMALRLNKLSLVWKGQNIALSLSLGLKSFGKHERAEEIFESASDDLQRNRKGQKLTQTK